MACGILYKTHVNLNDPIENKRKGDLNEKINEMNQTKKSNLLEFCDQQNIHP